MALDYGSARTGVAVSDPTGTLARPLGVVEGAAHRRGARRARAARARGRGRAGRRRAAADAARQARRAGGRDRALRRRAPSRRRRPRRAVRRALHDRPRAADGRRPRPRTRSRRRISFPAGSSGGARRPADTSAPVAAAVLVRRLVAVVAIVLVLGAVAAALVARGSSRASPPTTTIRQLRQFRILFPEGFTRAKMAARVSAVAKIAEHESHRKVKLSGDAYLAATRRPRMIPGFGREKLPLEGFLFPDTYDFDRKSTSAQLVREQLQEFQRSGRRSNLSYARSKNLTPYDVLTIASMVEGEAQVPSERPLVAAVIYNRLHAHMTLGIDATLRYGLHIPPTRVAHAVRARRATTRTTRGSSPACRRRRSTIPGSRRSRRRRIPRTSTTSTSCASRITSTTTSPRTTRTSSTTRPSTATEVVLCSATRSRTRSRPGCRTRPSRRPGSTGRTSCATSCRRSSRPRCARSSSRT